MAKGQMIRLLVLDNNDELNLHMVPEFRSLGYTVQFVNTANATSVQELHDFVREAAYAFRPHVAIIDLRLYDEDIDEDHGMQMLEHIRSAACILYSAYVTPDKMRRSFKGGFIDTIEKQSPPEELIAAVESASRYKSFVVNGCTIRWPPSWINGGVFAALFKDPCENPLDMVNDLVFQLCPKRRRFQADSVNRAVGAAPMGVGKRSMVFRIQADGTEPMVMKLATTSKIRRENIRYRRFIDGRIPGALYTRVENCVEFWDLGGISYSFVGTPVNSLTSFSSFYRRESDPEQILKPLRFFFNEVWIRHYEAARPRTKERSLFDLYDKPLDLTRRVEKLSSSPPKVSDTFTPMIVENPADWLSANREASYIPDAKVAITHGDLHGENIFVDMDGSRVWVIDFERTGCGHCLRDFAELVVDILINLLPEAGVSDFEFAQLCTDLLSFDSASGPSEPSPTTLNNPESAKAYAVADGIHEIAKTLTHFHDGLEYAWSLLFDAIFMASWSHAKLPQQARGFLLSALVCERLKIGLGAWPNETISAALTPNPPPPPPIHVPPPARVRQRP